MAPALAFFRFPHSCSLPFPRYLTCLPPLEALFFPNSLALGPPVTPDPPVIFFPLPSTPRIYPIGPLSLSPAVPRLPSLPSLVPHTRVYPMDSTPGIFFSFPFRGIVLLFVWTRLACVFSWSVATPFLFDLLTPISRNTSSSERSRASLSQKLSLFCGHSPFFFLIRSTQVSGF